MLPFLKPKQGTATGIIVKNRTPDKPEENQEDKPDDLESAMQELQGHLSAHDYKAAAECFRACFQMCEKAPHEEGPHTYDAQNEKAGQE